MTHAVGISSWATILKLTCHHGKLYTSYNWTKDTGISVVYVREDLL